MNVKQSAAISKMVYLNRPKGIDTLGGLVKHYSKPENQKNVKDIGSYKDAFYIIRQDTYLYNLKITGYQNDNDKTGFVGYAFKDDNNKGIVAFRGSENEVNPVANKNAQEWVDWAENISSSFLNETLQKNIADRFMKNYADGFSEVEVTGHSLGGRLAQQIALTNDRVTTAYTFNAPGSSDAFYYATKNADKSKIHAYRTTGDLVSLLLKSLVPATTVKGENYNLFDFFGNHDMKNFTDENRDLQPVNSPELLGKAIIGGRWNSSFLGRESAFLGGVTGLVGGLFIGGGKNNEEDMDMGNTGNSLEFFTETIPVVVEGLQTKFGELQDFIGGIWDEIGELFRNCWNSIIDFATEMVPGFIETVVTFISELPDKIWEWLVNIVTSIGIWISDMIAKAQEVIPGFIETVVTFISELPGKIWEFLVNIVTSIGTWISDMVAKAQEVIPGFIETVVTFISELPGKIWEFLVNIVTSIGTWISDMVAKAQEVIPGFIETVVTFISELPGKIWAHLTNAVSKIGEWAISLKNKANEVLPGVISSVMSFFEELPGKVLTVGGNLVKGVWDGISGSINWLYGNLKEWCNGVVDKIKRLFGINSPSKLMSDMVGTNIALGIAEGISENSGAITDAFGETLDALEDKTMDARDAVILAYSDIANAAKEGEHGINFAVDSETDKEHTQEFLGKICAWAEDEELGIPKNFEMLGYLAADNFENSFITRLKETFEKARAQIAAFQNHMVAGITASAELVGAGINNLRNTSYNAVYNVYGSNGKTTVQTLRDYENLKRQAGIV